jgi:CO/xanthine dehydrogenase Mo-binding subunit
MNQQSNKYVKKNQQRIGGFSIAMGGPIYADDMAPKNCLIIKLLRSPYPCAKVLSLDTRAARKVPGVEAVYTWEDIPQEYMYSGVAGEDEVRDKILLTDHPRYEGDPIALVAARDEASALTALRLLKPKWKIKEPITDLRESFNNPNLVHGDHIDNIVEPSYADDSYWKVYDPKRNLVDNVNYEFGDFEDDMARSTVQVDCTTYTGKQAHGMLETHRAYCYIDEKSGKYVIVGPLQCAFTPMYPISNATGIPPHKIRLIKAQVGGAFGGKNFYVPELYVAFVTKMTGLPSKFVLTRKECHGATGTRHDAFIHTRVGALDDGTVLALESDWLTDAGAYADHTGHIMFTGVHNVLPIYPNVKSSRIHQCAVYTNNITGNAFRGFGAPQTAFNFNVTMMLLADKLNMDINDLHLKNIGSVGDSHPLMNGYSEEHPVYLTSTALADCIKDGRKIFKWDERKQVKSDGRYYYGAGMAIAAHGSGVAEVDCGNAYIRLNFNESFTVFSGHCDLGTGSDTGIVQIASEVLNVPPEHITMVVADSETTPMDQGTYGSSNLYVNGTAVKDAATKLLVSMKNQAKIYMGISDDDIDVDFDQKGFSSKDGKYSLSFRKFCSKMSNYATTVGNLEASSAFPASISPSPFVATFVYLRIDRLTGKVILKECLNMVDCGTVMNPNLATIQVQGGTVQGIGHALYEDFKYTEEEHKLVSGSYQTYKIPSQMDIPDLPVVFVDSFEPTGPYGAKSVGEITTNAPAPAIANAIFNATGILMMELPITPEKMLRELHKKEKGTCSF